MNTCLSKFVSLGIFWVVLFSCLPRTGELITSCPLVPDDYQDNFIVSQIVFDNPDGSVPTQTLFDMRQAPNHNVDYPSVDTNDPNLFIQNSIDPAVETWFFHDFNMGSLGVYEFHLSGHIGVVGYGPTLFVNAIPAPSSAVFLVLASMVVLRRRLC